MQVMIAYIGLIKPQKNLMHKSTEQMEASS
jgi:hypothetical protein